MRTCCACLTLCLVVGAGCQMPDGSNLTAYNFALSTGEPHPLSASDIATAAQSGLHLDERVTSAIAYRAPGLGQSVVQVVVGPRDVLSPSAPMPRAYVVEEDGTIETTGDFWRHERAVRVARFGRMAPELFALQASLAPSDTIEVDITVRADVPEPMLPYDGTDKYVPTEEYEEWFTNHARAQVARIAQAKSRVLAVLGANSAPQLATYDGLPIIRARVSIALLRSQELNASDVTRIDTVPEEHAELLGDYAGHASMGATAMSGGLCGGACDGGTIDVGLWERPT